MPEILKAKLMQNDFDRLASNSLTVSHLDLVLLRARTQLSRADPITNGLQLLDPGELMLWLPQEL